jgi:hypothetical protein
VQQNPEVKLKILSSIIICFFLLWGCKSADDPAGPVSGGNIVGKIALHNTPNNAYGGVTVSLDGTSYYSTSTDDGTWELTDVPAGVYKFVFSKAGYFTQEFYNFQFVGNGTYNFFPFTLGIVPSESVAQLQAEVIDSIKSVYFHGLISPAVQTQQNVSVLLSTSPLTRSVPIEAFNVLTFGAAAGQYEFSLYYDTQYRPEISPGDTLYAIAYLGDSQYAGYSYNQITGSYVFNTPGVQLSNVVSVVVP